MPLLVFIFVFFVYVYLEISLLVSVGSHLGVLPMMLLMIAISVIGLWIVKARGIFTMWQVKKQLGEGKIPTQAVSSSVLFVLAGVLLIIPGFISDALAVLLMLPFSRKWLEKIALSCFANKVKFFSFSSQQYHHSQAETTFEAEFERKVDEDKRLK
ncbi:FxsA protein affecting phage T7 exclusion by the F plasmid [Bibersteinia trehalosi USDA-ARS-USMARC-190]|uniref:FxsA protein affecting phage T7 exclusion by the F plasmid n=1 Tax=Bibersteinia trehalosi USDA-ARS-USMARC-190 TaxID=1263832 RepID=W0R5X0_BIBTR|nr:FxsA family protein [Bibersteinia trehalosi]AHG85675.1 FxsA protein affecting phage T7 exclusion by the F plasmid [Bibersteinia trehalosi USDA-ARS-USMARC-190]